MGARTRGIANNILSDGLDATDGLSGALPSSNITNASVTNVTSTPSIGGGFEKLASDPPSPTEGDIWYNTTSNTVKGYVLALTPASWASGGTTGTARSTSSAGTQTANVIMGGQLSNSPFLPTSNVEEYDGTSWAEQNNTPYSASNIGGTGTQTAGLVFGGYPNVTTTGEYDGTNWTSGGSLGTGRELMTGGLGLQTAAFAVGGYIRPSTSTTAVEQYDGTSWTSAPSLNTGLYGRTGIGTTTAALASAGQSDPGTSDAVEEYNGSSWTTVNSRPYAAGSAMGSGIQTAALNYGGNPAGVLTTTVEYDGTNWTSQSSMSSARSMGGGSPGGSTTSALASTGNSTGATEEFTGAANVVQVKTLG
jgi:hypothetical protein